MHFKFSVNAN